jgi:polysaccharide pyruvyl transferase WcaK-like protein
MRPDPTRQKIALFGCFGMGNLGNEATLQAMVYNLRRRLPNVEISCICPAPENMAPEYNISAVPIRARFPGWKTCVSSKNDQPSRRSSGRVSGTAVDRLRLLKVLGRSRAALRLFAYPFLEGYRLFEGIGRLRQSNLLIMTGTGMLGDYAITPFGLHYDIVRWTVIAKLCGCKVLFVSVGGGPIRHPLSRWFVKVALAFAEYVSYRDASSKDYLKAIGVDVKDHPVYPDLAFGLPRTAVPANQDLRGQRAVIGVGVMNYHNRFGRSGDDETIYREYLGRVASFVSGLLQLRYSVRILIGDFVWDRHVGQDVRRALEERGLKYEGSKIIDEPTVSVVQLLTQLSSVDVVVSSRFHNLVLALMLGKPAMAISYHEKFQPLMNAVGLEGYCHDIEHIDVDELIVKVVKLQENAPAIKVRIAQETEDYRRALDEQYDRILKIARTVKTRKMA